MSSVLEARLLPGSSMHFSRRRFAPEHVDWKPNVRQYARHASRAAPSTRSGASGQHDAGEGRHRVSMAAVLGPRERERWLQRAASRRVAVVLLDVVPSSQHGGRERYGCGYPGEGVPWLLEGEVVRCFWRETQ
jgi:hypothetical protein